MDPVRDISKRQENPFRKHSRTRDANISACEKSDINSKREEFSSDIGAISIPDFLRKSSKSDAFVRCYVRLGNYVKKPLEKLSRIHDSFAQHPGDA